MSTVMAVTMPDAQRPFVTIGHSTRSVSEVANLIQAVGADMIIDVRKMPGSRTNPQFNSEALADNLRERQIGYRHIAALGGLRGRSSSVDASPNALWRNTRFRNYADYALTPPFKGGLATLIAYGRVARLRDHVRGSALVAVPPPDHCRLSARGWCARLSHHGSARRKTSCPHCRRQTHPRGTTLSIIVD